MDTSEPSVNQVMQSEPSVNQIMQSEPSVNQVMQSEPRTCSQSDKKRKQTSSPTSATTSTGDGNTGGPSTNSPPSTPATQAGTGGLPPSQDIPKRSLPMDKPMSVDQVMQSDPSVNQVMQLEPRTCSQSNKKRKQTSTTTSIGDGNIGGPSTNSPPSNPATQASTVGLPPSPNQQQEEFIITVDEECLLNLKSKDLHYVERDSIPDSPKHKSHLLKVSMLHE